MILAENVPHRDTWAMFLPRLLPPVLLGLALSMGGCVTLSAFPEPPRVSLVNIEPVDLNVFEQRYRLSLRVQNPNERRLPVEGMSYRVFLNGHEFAHGVSDGNFTIPGFGEELVEVTVVSSLLKIFQQLQALGPREREAFSWRITGSLGLARGFGTVPFEYEGTLEIPGREAGDRI